jgi:hypothetical protein
MEFKSLFIGMLLVALVVLSLSGFISQTQKNYNVTSPISTNPDINYLNELKNNVSTLFDNSNNSQSALYSENPSVDSGGLMLTTIVGAGKILTGSVRLIYDILVGGLAKNLGIDSSTLSILGTIMVGGIILLVWSLYRLGR